jgi:hypothetical protein
MSKKNNITAGSLLPWDQYAGLKPADALERMYLHAGETSKTIREWYWKSIKTKRWTSLWVRFLAFLFLVAGTILPLVAAAGKESGDRLLLTQWGVGALAVAGLLQVADRVFGWSSGWVRYIATVTAMESRTRVFELEWAENILEKGTPLNGEGVKAFFLMAKQMEEELLKLQEDETGKWITEFNSALALLETSVKTQREIQERTLETARSVNAEKEKQELEKAKARLPGAIELTFKFSTPAPKPVRIGLDSGALQDFTGAGWAQPGLSPGQHLVRIETSAVPPVVLQKIADVPAGGVCRLDITIPG